MPAPQLQLRPLALAPSGPGTEAELLIYGDIGTGWDDRTVEAADIVRQLNALPPSIKTIYVRINSNGGSVPDGLAIYSSLVAHPAEVRVRIDGVAASIASLIAMAGDHVSMPNASLLMIHAPWGGAVGNAADMRAAADSLDQFARAMAEAYARKSRVSATSIMPILEDGLDHWYTADEAAAAGFVDEVTDGALRDPPPSAFAQSLMARAPLRAVAALNLSAPAHLENNMPLRTPATNSPPTPTPPPPSGSGDMHDALLERNASIRSLFAQFSDIPGVRDLEATCLADTRITMEQVQARLLARVSNGATPLSARGVPADDFSPSSANAPGDGSDFLDAASDALLIRAGLPPVNAHAGARDFRHVSAIEMARTCLGRAGRRARDPAMSAADVIRAAMSTSDFPGILENALHKAVRRGMEVPATSHRTWCRLSEAQDFKPQARVLLGSAPSLLPVGEFGEYQHGNLAEDKASLTAGKYGRIIKLSYEALINDDLGAFLAVGPSMGGAALRAEADGIYTKLTANSLDGVAMQDGKVLFHADHSNAVSVATGTGKPLTAAALSAARAKLRRQTGVAGELLNLAPKFLLVPPERETEAEILVASSTVSTSQASAQAAPGWMASLVVVAEPRLTNTDTLYLVADNMAIDTGEVATLPGSPQLITEDSFNHDARSWKVRHSFATALLDYRGFVRLTLTAA